MVWVLIHAAYFIKQYIDASNVRKLFFTFPVDSIAHVIIIDGSNCCF